MPRANFILFLLVLLLTNCAQGQDTFAAPVPAVSFFFRPHFFDSRFYKSQLTRLHAPRPQATPFRRLAEFGLAAWAADTTSTQVGLARGDSELNPILGAHPSPARLWATSISLEGIFLYACHRESVDNPKGKFWKAAMRLSLGLHTAGTVNNAIALR